MATMNISLPKTMKSWIEEQAEKDQFSNTSDYVRQLVRKDQERTRALDTLQQAVSYGLSKGDAEDFDFKEFKARMLDKSNH